MEYNVFAAKWWTRELRNLVSDNSDGVSKASPLELSIATIQPKVNESAIDMFEEELAKKIKGHVERHGSMTIAVDWLPDNNLAEVARSSGINVKNFSTNTVMWVNQHKVTVQKGYDGRKEIVFYKG